MSLILNQCVEYDEDRKICVADENGKRYTLNNALNYRIRKIRVDGCVPQKPNEHRCDYLICASKNEESKAIFIELKGGALVDAVRQLNETISYLGQDLKGHKICARIIGSKDVPNLINLPAYKTLYKNTRGNVKRATNKLLTENIENI